MAIDTCTYIMCLEIVVIDVVPEALRSISSKCQLLHSRSDNFAYIHMPTDIRSQIMLPHAKTLGSYVVWNSD